ncbi:MAG: alpha/beta hydrolase [Armatimonadota bacterium]
MALCQVRFFSQSLGKASEMIAVLPDAGDGPFPVLYLLHGLSDDASIWLRRSRIEWYVRDLPLIVVMPDGGRGWYTNALNGDAYEDHIVKDVIGQTERIFPASWKRQHRAIAGLSMGGYGAMSLALHHPDLFVAAASLSGAVGIGHKPITDEMPLDFKRIFGENPEGSDKDLFTLIQKADKAQLPALWLDCGVEDFLIEDNRAFHNHLQSLDVPHIYHEFPGAHTWDYWDEHIQEVLQFVMEHMKG